MSKVELRVDWCDYKAAKFAVMNWHYSKRMPMPPLITLGVWENSLFVGSVIFARGNTPSLGSPYDLQMMQVCELVRIALRQHQSPVSEIGSKCIRLLKLQNPGLKLIVSFADPAEGHHGGIYQAMNWVYCGKSAPDKQYYFDGRWQHSREIRGGAFGQRRKIKDYSGLPTRVAEGKHRYIYPLDRAMRKQIAPLAKPYPKREACGQSVEGDTSGDQPEEAGSIPADRSIESVSG